VGEKQILSNQIIILLGQILELKVEIGLLRGKPLETAIEEAFAFVDGSPLFCELFDNSHLEQLKAEFHSYFCERPEARE
jgi:hypothetical protein